MKDIQGIQRGKCNSCECVEYRTPEEGKYSCGYCGHRPVEHVRIVELGGCRGKDCDCDKYSSDDPNSYTDCQYCGCGASVHEGAEALRKSKPQPPPTATVPVSAVTAGLVAVSGHPGAPHTMQQYHGTQGIQPRLSSTGEPVQSMSFGECSRPGCSFPKRREGMKLHDYCSRTCAQKHSQSFHQQKLASAQQAAHFKSSQVGAPQAAPQMGGGTTTPCQQSQTMCKKCNKQPPNTGRSWCESCYLQSQSLQKP